jgi:diaminopimelate decarboxylase
MRKPSRTGILRAAGEILSTSVPELTTEDLIPFVGSYFNRADRFLERSRSHGSPLYIFEPDQLSRNIQTFRETFSRRIPDIRLYYAVKSNNLPDVASCCVKEGIGLDVSSGDELRLALAAGAREIVFSGPGKTEAEHRLAVEHRDRVTVLLDSEGEMRRLADLAGRLGVEVRCGIRVTTDERGLWRKFGIPLSSLRDLLAASRCVSGVNIRGVQFHTSWNRSPEAQVRFIERLGVALDELPAQDRVRIEFIDMGGGFWPPRGEWLQPAGTARGRLLEACYPDCNPHQSPHHILPAEPLTTFADQIAAALEKHIFRSGRCTLYAEPGRWLCHDVMHLLLTVIDRKAEDLVITDGGTNAVGWERFEHDYFPVLNLSRPALRENACVVMGSLCTPHDVWGYTYWGDGIGPGDRLLIPTQGAYTYSLRQHFIKALPSVVHLSGSPE